MTHLKNLIAFFRQAHLGNNNDIEFDFVSANLYSPDLPDDKMFFFGIQFDKNNQPIINLGSENFHFRLLMTTIVFDC
jgi:hypothetical protein